MKLSAFIACGVLLALPASARADGARAKEDQPVHLAAGFDYMSVRTPEVTIARRRFTLSPEFSFGSRLTIAPTARLTSTSLDLREQDNLPLDLSLTLPWDPSIGSRAELRMVDVWRFRLSLRGEFEFPLSQNQVHIDSYTPKRELLIAPIDVDTLRNHVQVNHLWRSGSGSLVLSGRIGPVRPYAEFGVMAIDSSLALSPDRKAQSVLDAQKVRLDRFYQEGGVSPFYTIGAHVDLGKGFSVRLGGSYFTTGERSLFITEGAFVVPLDIVRF